MKKILLSAMFFAAILLTLTSCANTKSDHVHKYGAWKITKEATCSEEGVETRYCAECGSPKTRSIPMVEHVLTPAFPGPESHELLCRNCNYITSEKHSFGDWVTTTEATCEFDGLEVRRCICDHGESRPIEATGHSLIDENNMLFSMTVCQSCGVRDFTEHTYLSTSSGSSCGKCEAKLHNSMLLEFALSEDENSYTLVGIGAHTEPCIVIPYVYNDLPVTSIAAGAFEGSDLIESLLIPSSVTVIGDGAFKNCSNLRCAKVYNSIEVIGKDAFEGAPLEYVEAPVNVLDTVSKQKLIAVTLIGDGVLTENYFAESALEGLFIKSSKIVLEGGALRGCASLTSLTLAKIDIGTAAINEESAYFGYLFGRDAYGDAEPIRQWFDSENHDLTYDFYIPKTLTTIKILSGNIPEKYFVNCTSLLTLTVESEVDTVGDNAFNGCTNLRYVSLNSRIIGEGAFAVSSDIRELHIGSRVSIIGASCFHEIDSLYIRSEYQWCTIRFLGYYANPMTAASAVYINGVLCETFTVPNGITALTQYAFYNAPIKSIFIPESVSNIDTLALTGWQNSFASIEVSAANRYYTSMDGVLYDKNMSTLIRYPAEKLDDTYEIPASVTAIAECAFAFSSLKYIEIPSTVTYIGSAAFMSSSKLERISVTFIGESKNGEGSDKFASIFGSNYGYGYDVPSSLTQITVRECAFIPSYSFYKQNIKEIILVDVIEIGGSAFYECEYLESVTVNDGLKKIGNYAFSNCSNLNSINIPDSVEYIGAHAFRGAPVREQENGVYYVGKWATDIHPYVFVGNATLRADTVGLAEASLYPEPTDNVESKLAELALPEGLKYICDNVFWSCKSLTSITIPASVVRIGTGVFSHSGLRFITVAEGNTRYYSSGNCVIETATGELIIGASASQIPSTGVKSIAEQAFSGTLITSVVIPDTVTSIGYAAFWGCNALTSVVLSSNLTSVGMEAFTYCDALITNEYDNAYYIGSSDNPYFFLLKAKDESISSCSINVNTKFIGSDAFNSCENLTSIYIPQRVMWIGEWAFANCYSLESVTFAHQSELTYIGTLAFRDCVKLEELRLLGENLETIADGAFSGCAIKDIYFAGTAEKWAKFNSDDQNHAAFQNATMHYGDWA